MFIRETSKVSRKVGKKNGLGESKKTGDYDYGKGGSNKGGDNPVRKTKRKAKSSCVKDGKAPAPSTLPKPGYMYPPSYPP